MKRILSLVIVITMVFILPLSVYAGIEDVNQEIDISGVLNYDLVIQKKSATSFYSGTPLEYAINKSNIEETKTIGDISYNLNVNDFGENDSIYVSESDIEISGLTGLTGENGYTPKPKKLGFVAGTMENTADIKISVSYADGMVDELPSDSFLSVSPITEKDSELTSVSAGASLVKDVAVGNKYTVKNGAEVFLNSYTSDVKPSEITSITFKKGEKPYHISAVTILYYSESEWQSNVGSAINDSYADFKDATPDDTGLNLSALNELIVVLNSTKDQIIAGDEIGLSDDVKTALNERGVDNEIERLTMLYDCISLTSGKQTLKDEMDALLLSEYLDDTSAEFSSYNTDDENNITSLLEKFDEAEELIEKLTPVLAYWEEKGVIIETVEINLSDKETLKAVAENYNAYKSKKAFEDAFLVISSYIEKSLDDVTSAEFGSIKAFFENADFFDAEFNSSYIDSENEEKIASLKYIYLNFEKYKNAEQPHMVDLSEYFSRDIFYDAGDSGNKIGFKGSAILSYDGSAGDVTDTVKTPDKDVIIALDRNVITQSLNLNKENGILSFADADINLAYGYYKTGHVTSADLKSYMAGKPLTFDVSKTMTNGASAVMLPDDGSGGAVQNISGVFSGKSAKYLVFLVPVPRNGKNLEVKINYTDGTSYSGLLNNTQRDFFYVNYNAAVDTGAMGSSNAPLRTTPWYYNTASATWVKAFDDSTGFAHARNGVRLVASAALIPNKQIESIEIYSTKLHSGDAAQFDVSSNIPILAVTEIPITNADFVEKVAAPAWEAVKNFDPDTDYVAENLAEMKAVEAAYNEALLRGVNVDEIFKYDDGSSGVADIEEMATLVLTATSLTERTKVDEIKSTINFSVPAANIEDCITVAKNDEKLKTSDYTLIAAEDGLSAQIVIPESKNGGNKYDFKVSGALSVKSNTSMTMGNDYSYSYTVPDYISYDYDNKKLVNNSDIAVTVTVATVAVGTDGKTVYSADSATVTDLSKESPADVSIALSNSIPSDSKKLSYVFDTAFRLVSNDSDIAVISNDLTDENANYKEPVFNIKTNTLTIKGFTSSKTAGKVVNLKIYDDSYSKDIYFGSVKTNKDGYFQFEIILPESTYFNSFEMSFTLGGDDFLAPVTDIKDVYYSTSYEKTALITYLKEANTVDAITNGTLTTPGDVTISRIVRDLALDFAPVDVISDNGFAQSIINILKDYELSALTSDFELTQKVLKQAAILTAYKEDKKDVIYKDGVLLYNDIMDYDSIDSNNVTLYEIFSKNVSSLGKDVILNSLTKAEYKNPAELYDALEKSIFTHALNYPISLGTGYITSTLTDKNAAAVGIDISKYTSVAVKDSFNSAIAQNKGKFTDVASVKSFIDSYIIPTVSVIVPSGGGSSSGGGSAPSSSISTSGFDTQNDSASGAFAKPDINTEEASATFSDVSEKHWAYKNIMSLYNKGIVSGKGDKKFDPDGYVTRGEVVKMICVALNLTEKAENPFNDTIGKWYSDYAAIAYANKLVNGVSDAYFGGDEKISRQDLCTILYRIKNEETASEIKFTDKENIAEYAKDAVLFMNEKGIVNGFSDNTFRPSDYCTRAQMAKIFDLFIGL